MWYLPQEGSDHHMSMHSGHVYPFVLSSLALEGESCHGCSHVFKLGCHPRNPEKKLLQPPSAGK
eukprot:319189-Karenia_brevis.AAC.1